MAVASVGRDALEALCLFPPPRLTAAPPLPSRERVPFEARDGVLGPRPRLNLALGTADDPAPDDEDTSSVLDALLRGSNSRLARKSVSVG